jgi:hypothetical protein
LLALWTIPPLTVVILPPLDSIVVEVVILDDLFGGNFVPSLLEDCSLDRLCLFLNIVVNTMTRVLRTHSAVVA